MTDERLNASDVSESECIYFEKMIFKRKLDFKPGEECVDTDSGLNSVSASGLKKRKPNSWEKVDFGCEWTDCSFRTDDIYNFVDHVADHVPQSKIKIPGGNRKLYVCFWNSCCFKRNRFNDIAKHINFHSYHTKLKSIGINCSRRAKMPKCRRESNSSVKQLFDQLCEWNGCSKSFDNYQSYLWHVATHMEAPSHRHKRKRVALCKWGSCRRKFITLYRLKVHVRCHTKEKTIACPDCGAMFASNGKFVIHCKRQALLNGSSEKLEEIAAHPAVGKESHLMTMELRSKESKISEQTETELKVECAYESFASHIREAELVPEGYNLVGSNPDNEFEEEFHAVMEEIKSEDTNMYEQTERGMKIEPGTEFSLLCNKDVESISEGQSSINSEPKQEEEAHAAMEDLACDETNIAKQIDSIDFPPIISSGNYEPPRFERNIQICDVISQSSEDTLLSHFCRLCATRGNNMVFMFDSNLLYQDVVEKIEQCLPITVKKTDTLTKQACHLCLQKLESFYQFYIDVAEAEKQLLMFDEQTSGELEETSENFQVCPVQNERCDVTECAHNEGEGIGSPNGDTNSDKSTIISQSPPIADGPIENNEFPLKLKSCIDNLSQESGVRNSNNEHQGAVSSIDTLNSGRRSVLQNQKGILCSIENSPICTELCLGEESNSDDRIYDPEIYSPPITRSQRASKRLREEVGKENCDDDTIFCGRLSKDQSSLGEMIKSRIFEEPFQPAGKCYTRWSIHAPTNEYPCCFCDNTFKSEKDWKRHSLDHLKGESCERTSVGARLNLQELDNESNVESCYGKKCDQVIDSERSESNKQPEESCCNVFNRELRTREQLDAHQTKYDQASESPLRKKSSPFNVVLKMHRQTPCRPLSTKNSFACPDCGKIFARKCALVNHARIHTGKKSYRCGLCGKSFSSKLKRDDHRKAHFEEKLYKCSLCNKSFSTLFIKRQHITIDHMRRELYYCDVCGHLFGRFRNLRRHRVQLHKRPT